MRSRLFQYFALRDSSSFALDYTIFGCPYRTCICVWLICKLLFTFFGHPLSFLKKSCLTFFAFWHLTVGPGQRAMNSRTAATSHVSPWLIFLWASGLFNLKIFTVEVTIWMVGYEFWVMTHLTIWWQPRINLRLLIRGWQHPRCILSLSLCGYGSIVSI